MTIDTAGRRNKAARWRTPAQLLDPVAFIRHYIGAHESGFAAVAVTVMVAAVCAVLVQYQMKLLVDAMSGRTSISGVWRAFIVFITLIGFESVLWRLGALLTCRLTIGVGVDMRLDLFDYLGGQSIRYFADNLAGSLGQRVTGTAGNFGALVNTTVWRIVPPFVDFAGALVIFTLVDWRMAVAMGVFVVIVTTALILVGERGRPLHTAYFGRASQVAGEVTDVISNMWAVKAFSARRREWNRLRAHCQEEARMQRTSWMYTEKIRIGYDLVLCLMAAGMLYWAVRSWSLGRVTPGDVVVVSALTFRILHGSRDVALALVDVGHQFGFIDDTLRVIGQVHSIIDPPDAASKTLGRGSVVFRGVNFGYDPQRPVLRNLNIDIRPGEKVGIVGPSGAGKTTIVQLIQRLYDIQDGEILIDGQRVDSVTQDSLRASLSVVPQEITLFHRTVMDNIRFGRPDATEEEVLCAAKAARCDDFVRRLPHGYDTLVGERGVKLSGGQRQRVGIARAFLKDAPILIFDEATSALDTESEIGIQRSVTELLRERTVIAVAHRLSTLMSFDRILVVDRGRVVEQGSPAELRRSGRVFDSMWRLQVHGLAERPAQGREARA